MRTCTSQGRDVAAPPRDLPRISLLQALSFLVNNNLISQSWAQAGLMLRAQVYDKTVDLSELSPTNHRGDWSTHAAHRAAALTPCSSCRFAKQKTLGGTGAGMNCRETAHTSTSGQLQQPTHPREEGRSCREGKRKARSPHKQRSWVS